MTNLVINQEQTPPDADWVPGICASCEGVLLGITHTIGTPSVAGMTKSRVTVCGQPMCLIEGITVVVRMSQFT